MAHNSSRRSIEFLVYGALPPHGTNVLWMDSSIPSAPVLKIWWDGAWVPCHTEQSREYAALVETIKVLADTNKELTDQVLEEIEQIKIDIRGLATEAKATANKKEILEAIQELAGHIVPPYNSIGTEQIKDNDVMLVDLNEEVKQKMEHDYDESNEALIL